MDNQLSDKGWACFDAYLDEPISLNTRETFNLLYEITMLNGHAPRIEGEDYNSFKILFEGSKNLPRKRKKQLRRLLS